MGTATIFGDIYTTAIMPDGKEWLAQNLRTSLAPNKAPNGNEANAAVYGRLYQNDIATALTYPDGWRVPTQAEWDDLIVACGGAATSGGKLKSTGTAYWQAPNTSATDEFGFTALPAGSGYRALFFEFGQYANFWTAWAMSVGLETRYLSYNTTDVVSYDLPGGNPPGDYWYSVRLVREYVPPPPPSQIPAEAHETTHALALEWTEAADGTPVAYDDGAAYDYIESTITARMTPAELTALETAWQSSTKLYTIYSTGYLLGPLIDMSAGVEVRLMSYQVDQSADSSMTLYDVTIGVHYGPLSAPSAGSLAVVQSRGRPYHSVAPGAASWITEGGTSDVNAYGRASERSCTWYTHSLTTAQAADVVNALRTLRGSSTTWTAGGVATPWGPSESGTATVWIPEWSVHRESNLLWGVQMELVRNG